MGIFTVILIILIIIGVVLLWGCTCYNKFQELIIRANAAERINDNVLKEDVLLSSPSAAASFVSGSARNGNLTWKTAEGLTLRQLDEKSDNE